MFTILVLLSDFLDNFHKEMKDQINHHNNNNPSIMTERFINDMFVQISLNELNNKELELLKMIISGYNYQEAEFVVLHHHHQLQS